MSVKNLLVEVLVEELPPKALKTLGESFATTLSASLKSQGLTGQASAITAYASPRRLAAHVSRVSAKAADKSLQQKLMPVSVALDANGNATPALLKRLAALNADASVVRNLTRKLDGKSETLYLDIVVPGVSLVEGLQNALAEAIDKLPIPKVMSYQLADGWSSVHFVRPAHSLVALHGADVVPVSILGLQASRRTRGHRFEATLETIELRDADSYEQQLKTEGAVIASFSARRAEIARQLDAAAASVGLKPIEDAALLDEVTALVERPNVLVCRFEEEFLAVPQECLILTMKANQKYFPLLDSGGKLTNKFLVVSNIRPSDASAVVSGNERVVRPRLADAKFFYDQDRKTRLEARVPKLGSVVYHGKLGSQLERVQRIQLLAGQIARMLGADAMLAERAAWLSKADLLTNMVGEFPELQGIMGRYYARHDGEPAAVAEAIAAHYQPRYAGDTLPEGVIASAVALADKLDALAGLFGIGQQPTGEKDPFGLRRAALGVIRILVESELPLDLDNLLKIAIDQYPAGLLTLEWDDPNGAVKPLWVKLSYFMTDRAGGYLRERGFTPQEADAVLYLTSKPSEYVARLEAIRSVRAAFPAEFEALATADKRARNIIAKSPNTEGTGICLTDPKLAREESEQRLLAITREIRAQVDRLASQSLFREALGLTIRISQPVTAFFDSVMVNVDDRELRTNRFNLLHEVTGLTNKVADLSKLAA